MNKNLLRWTLSATTALAISVGMAAPALAQDDGGMSDIVVTARRVEERLQDVPISIQVFDQEQLEEQNISSGSDLATITPSLSSNNFFGSANASFAIRGFVQDIGTAPSVGVYFADVVALRGGAITQNSGEGAGPGSFFDLQNVQVLKGPQGTLFGRNTTGGAILLVPQRPTDEFGGYVSASAGNFDMTRVQGVVNLPLSDDARLRVGMDRQERQGYLNNTSGIGPDDLNDVNYESYRASLVVDLAPNLENYTVATYSISRTNGSINDVLDAPGYTPGANASAGCLAAANAAFGVSSTNGSLRAGAQQSCEQLYREEAAGNNGFYDVSSVFDSPESYMQQWQLINTTSWDVNDNLTFKNIVSYGELVNDSQASLFGTDWINASGVRGLYATSVPVKGHTASQSTFTNEMRLEGTSFDSRLSWQAGFYLEDSRPIGFAGSASPIRAGCVDYADANTCTALRPSASVINYNETQASFSSRGIYTQGSFDITERLTATLGYRYTWDDSQVLANNYTRFLNFTPGAPGFQPDGSYFSGAINNPLCSVPQSAPPYNVEAGDCFRTLTVHSDAPTWVVGLDYHVTDDLMVYAKYAQGYRAGTVNPSIAAPYNATRPEQVDAYEIGQKWSFGRGILNTAFFYNDFSDQQLIVSFLNTLSQSTLAAPLNVGASVIYGFEGEFSYRPIDDLTLSVNYTYLNTEITAVSPPTVALANTVLNSDVRVGDNLALSPEHKVTLSAQYVLPLNQALGEISLGATFIHTGEMVSNYVTRNSSGDLSGYSVVEPSDTLNLNLKWESIAGSPFDLLLFGANVTEEEYYSYYSGTARIAGADTGYIAPPRMYGAQLTYRFGGER